jgi:subtilisin family serine protease
MGKRGKKRYFISSFVALSLLCSIILIINSKLVTAGAPDPDFYYYYGARKMELTLSTEKLAVRFKQGLTIEEQKAVVESEPSLGLFSQREESPAFRLVILPLLNGVTEEYALQTIKGLNSRAELEVAFPIFVLPSSEIVLTDEFIVRFDPNVPADEIDAFNALNGVEIIRELELRGRYVLKVKEPKNINALEIANLCHESPITIYSVPNFVGRTERLPAVPNDEYFEEQWPLDNTGENSGDTPGTEGADIDAPGGWSISTGSPDIVIAVLDSGVDLGHDDLENKLVDRVDRYNAYDDNDDPSPGAHWANAHGTLCAGLAAAETDNGIGIAGVGWNCMLMPIKVCHKPVVGDWDWTLESLANGITWAANHGADVLSCSWPELADEPVVHGAIIDAKTNGREGKGCVLVFAAHNYNWPLTFPSAYPEVIAVGATDDNDDRWDVIDHIPPNPGSGSNYGPELDVVAPTGWGPGQGVIMWTTDIRGNAGYNPNAHPADPGDDDDYYKWFLGTSAATPQVAGLAGLILSVNPELTAYEVQFIIESTADDQKGNPLEDIEGWDQYYGWGRININNALEAVELQLGAWCVARWKFDEGEGTIAQDSAGGYDGTLIGDPEWVNGYIGDNALDFDGAGDCVYSYGSDGYDSPLNIYNSDLTISAWVKVRGSGTIVARSKGGYITYRLGVAAGKAFINTYKSGSGHWILYGDEILDLNTWYHIVGV